MDAYKEFEWLVLALEKDLDRQWEEYFLEKALKQKLELQPENHHHHRHRLYRSIGHKKYNPVRKMPELLIDHITTQKGGRDIKLVIQKSLSLSDLWRSNGRFSIPIAQVKNKFLTWEEDEFLRRRSGYGWVNQARVRLVEPSVCEEAVVSLRWEMEKNINGGRRSSGYVLVGSWVGVVERNGFRVGDIVQLWSFRVGYELNFAMVVVQRADDESDYDGDEDEAQELE